MNEGWARVALVFRVGVRIRVQEKVKLRIRVHAHFVLVIHHHTARLCLAAVGAVKDGGDLGLRLLRGRLRTLPLPPDRGRESIGGGWALTFGVL